MAVRQHLSRDRPSHFQALSRLAEQAFEGDEAHQQMEGLYHRLVIAPEEAADDLRRLCDADMVVGGWDMPQPLKASLEELVDEIELKPVARARALLCLGLSKKGRVADRRVEGQSIEEQGSEEQSVERQVRESAELFQSLHRRAAESEAEARTVLGDVLSIDGRGDNALAEYGSAKEIRHRLMQLYSDDPLRKRDLAELYGRCGNTLRAQRRLGEALEEVPGV